MDPRHRPDAPLRDGSAAVALAERAQRLAGDDPSILDTLAAAYAESGRHEEAVAKAQRALALARAAGSSALVAELTAHLSAYQRGDACGATGTTRESTRASSLTRGGGSQRGVLGQPPPERQSW